jgi:hypothetical protein
MRRGRSLNSPASSAIFNPQEFLMSVAEDEDKESPAALLPSD